MKIIKSNKMAKSVSLNDFLSDLAEFIEKHKYNIDESILSTISMASKIKSGDVKGSTGVSVFAILSVLHCLLRIRDDQELKDRELEQLKLFEKPWDIISSRAEGILGDNVFKDSKPEDWMYLEFISNMSYNSIIQRMPLIELVNTMVLTGLRKYKDLEAEPTWVNKYFKEKVKISAENYYELILIIWAYSLRYSKIDMDIIFKKFKKNKKINKEAARVINSLSLKVDNSKIEIEKDNSLSGKARVMSFFSIKPLIKYTERYIFITSKSLIELQLTSKFLHKSLSYAREIEGVKSTAYSDFLGLRFEKYFYQLAKDWLGDNQSSVEYEYLQKENRKSPDFVCFEKHGKKDVVNLIQLKIKMPRETTFYPSNKIEMEKDLSKFSELLYKSIQYLYQISSKNSSLKIECKEFSLKVLNSKYINLVGVIPIAPQIFNFRYIRSIIWREAINNLSQSERVWFNDYNVSKKIKWHIFTLSEMQHFLKLDIKKRNLNKELTSYHKKEKVDADLLFHMKNKKMPEDFTSYLRKKYRRSRNITESDSEFKQIEQRLFEGIEAEIM